MADPPLTPPLDGTWPDPGHHLIVGPPQSGKTTAAVAAFVDYVRRHGPQRAVFLTPTRQRAAALQSVIAREFGGTTGRALVRTPASLAFGLLRQAAISRGEPAPTLITGPEQDHILAELIAGHLADGGGPTWPSDITPEVLTMRAFRDELRDLLMRAAEAGLDGGALAALGRERGRMEWVAAGELLAEYTAVTALGETTPDRGARYDAATILDQATGAVAGDPALATFDAVVHDDYQDATLATSRLLGELTRQGAQLLLAANPDTGVQGFRGGLPALTRTAALPEGSVDGAFGAQVHVLTRVHMNPGVWEALAPVAEDLPPLVGAARRRATAAGEEGEGRTGRESSGGPVETVVLPSTAGESAYIARRLRELHVLEGRAWSELAVVVRGHHQLARLRRSLAHAGVPVRVTGAEVALREEPAVVALLTCLDVAARAGGPTSEEVAALLLSAFGGLDALGLRRLRRALRHHDPARPSADLLVDSMEDETLRVAGGNHVGVHRIARMLEAGRAAIRGGAGVETALWRVWEASGVAEAWQEQALSAGAGAARADADLDAVVTLFTAAEQFTARRTGAEPREFIEYLAAQDFPADTLAARASHSDAVALHTPASAAGEQWPIVIVAGVQEDTWPDLRLRDTLLGASELTDLVTSRHRGNSAGHEARAEVAADERRTFLAACSRARERLLVTAVLDADTRPSMFFDRVSGGPQVLTGVPAPLDLRGLVGELRAHLAEGEGGESGPAAGRRSEAAAALLGDLAAAGVAEADPGVWSPQWSGRGPVLGAEKVTLNPSAIELVLTCPLQWFLTSSGGRRAETRAQNLGNLIHDIARNHPRGTHEELAAELDARWHELDLPANHIGARARERAEGMIAQLADYIATHPAPARVEVDFEVDVGPAILRGQVDRVEDRAEGPHVVDFKTGARAPRRGEENTHPQLGAYQLAASHGAFGPTVGEGHTAGASLVFLAVNKKVHVREQPPLQEAPDPEWAAKMVEEAARIVTGAEFPARPSPACSYCPVRSACPALDEGARLGEAT